MVEQTQEGNESKDKLEIEGMNFEHLSLRHTQSYDHQEEIMHKRTMLESIKEIDEEQ